MKLSKAGLVQLLTGISASSMFVLSGMHGGWLVASLPILQDETISSPALTSSEGAWISASLQIGGVLGPILGQFSANTIGRKTNMFFSSFPSLITFSLYLFGSNVYLLCFARCISGISFGIAYTVVPAYISEIASPSIRGLLGGLIMVLYGSGKNLELLLIPNISFNWNIYICLSVTMMSLLSILLITESPYWFIIKGEDVRAEKALRHLLQVENVTQEMKEMKESWMEQINNKSTVMEVIGSKSTRTAVIISFGSVIIQTIGGAPPIMGFTMLILGEGSLHIISSTIAGCIILSMFVIGSLVGSHLCDKFGRRPMFMVSTFICALTTFVCGFYFYLLMIEYEYIETLELVPVVSLTLFTLGFGLGLANLPYIFCSELFPTNQKALACCLISVCGAAVSFSDVKGYQMIKDSAGIHVAFWIFTVLNIIGLLFGYFYVFETKGMSLTEIQTALSEKRSDDDLRN